MRIEKKVFISIIDMDEDDTHNLVTLLMNPSCLWVKGEIGKKFRKKMYQAINQLKKE